MRYYYTKNTLYIRGSFRAASTGVDGGLRNVSTLLNHTVDVNYPAENPLGDIRDLVHRHNYNDDVFGLLTAVWMQDLCILQYDYITVFVTAGVSNPNPDPRKPHTINIIVTSDEGFTDQALLGAILTATEAKTYALRLLGRDFTGTTSDAVIIASEGEVKHTYAGTFTEPGKRIYESVLKGVMEAVQRHEGTIPVTSPSYFIYSRYENTGWFEWKKEGCPYHPCHGLKDQSCDFCYCPFYPCKDETLGEWVESSTMELGKLWSCSNCLLNHDPKRVEYLKAHPDISFEEFKNVPGIY